MELIDKAAVIAEIERRLKALADTSRENNREFAAIIGAENYQLINLLQYINTLEVKEVNYNDTFINKAWDWIEDNILSSNQQDKSRLYYKQFENYIKGE